MQGKNGYGCEGISLRAWHWTGGSAENGWISLTWVSIIHSTKYPNKPKGRECWNTMPDCWMEARVSSCLWTRTTRSPYLQKRLFNFHIYVIKVLWCSFLKWKLLWEIWWASGGIHPFWLYAFWRTLINSPWKQCFKSIKKHVINIFKKLAVSQ